MLSCKDISALVSRSMDERLSWRQRMAVRLHLTICSGCSRFAGQMSFLRQAARRYPGVVSGRNEDSR